MRHERNRRGDRPNQTPQPSPHQPSRAPTATRPTASQSQSATRRTLMSRACCGDKLQEAVLGPYLMAKFVLLTHITLASPCPLSTLSKQPDLRTPSSNNPSCDCTRQPASHAAAVRVSSVPGLESGCAREHWW